MLLNIPAATPPPPPPSLHCTISVHICPPPPGPVYHEGCDCPQPSGPAWESSMRCPASFPQIERDLALYPRVDPDRNAREIPQRFGQRQSLCHYTVKDNKVTGLRAYIQHDTVYIPLVMRRPLKQYMLYIYSVTERITTKGMEKYLVSNPNPF